MHEVLNVKNDNERHFNYRQPKCLFVIGQVERFVRAN